MLGAGMVVIVLILIENLERKLIVKSLEDWRDCPRETTQDGDQLGTSYIDIWNRSIPVKWSKSIAVATGKCATGTERPHVWIECSVPS